MKQSIKLDLSFLGPCDKTAVFYDKMQCILMIFTDISEQLAVSIFKIVHNE